MVQKNMWGSLYAEVHIQKVRVGLCGRRLPDFLSRNDGEYCSNKKGRRRNTASLNHICMYSTIPQPRAPFFATTLLPKFHTCRGRIPGLSASHFAPDCENAEESTSGQNSSLVLTCWGIKSFSCCYFASLKRISKNSWKTPEIRKHETDQSRL